MINTASGQVTIVWTTLTCDVCHANYVPTFTWSQSELRIQRDAPPADYHRIVGQPDPDTIERNAIEDGWLKMPAASVKRPPYVIDEKKPCHVCPTCQGVAFAIVSAKERQS